MLKKENLIILTAICFGQKLVNNQQKCYVSVGSSEKQMLRQEKKRKETGLSMEKFSDHETCEGEGL